MDPYRMLGLARDADTGQIRAAYRQQVRTAHPDAGGSDTAFFRLQDAYRAALDGRATARDQARMPPPPDRRDLAGDGDQSEGWSEHELRRHFASWRRVRALRLELRRAVTLALLVQVLLLTAVAVRQPTSPVPVVLASLGTGLVSGAVAALVVARRRGRI